jgi:hypothetical protein
VSTSGVKASVPRPSTTPAPTSNATVQRYEGRSGSGSTRAGTSGQDTDAGAAGTGLIVVGVAGGAEVVDGADVVGVVPLGAVLVDSTGAVVVPAALVAGRLPVEQAAKKPAKKAMASPTRQRRRHICSQACTA